MADLKAMRKAAEYRGGHGYMTESEHLQWLALLDCAEALVECVELLKLRGLIGECTKMGDAAIDKLERAP